MNPELAVLFWPTSISLSRTEGCASKVAMRGPHRMRGVTWVPLRVCVPAISLLLLLSSLEVQHAQAQATPTSQGQDASRAQPPRAWADAGAASQERIINADQAVPIRYRTRKVDAHGDTTRVVIESRDGAVARLIARNGVPLTRDEDTAERDRLGHVLEDPDAFIRHHRRERAGREYATELVRALPGAMIWTYVQGQPQLTKFNTQQVVLDFTPDPHYKPPTLVTEGLTGLAGRVWIDTKTHCVLRIEGRILHPLDFGWGGMLARVGEGGTVELEQTQAAEHRWFYSHLAEHVTLREMLVHTVSENSESNAWDATPLPTTISLQDAVHELLAMPVATAR